MAGIRPDVEAIFFAAKQKRPQDRAAYLDEVCSADRELRRRVEQFLSAQAALGSFLETPMVQRAAEELAGRVTAAGIEGESPSEAEESVSLEFLTPSDKPDSLGRLGHYEILEVIGHGGMGMVFRALDEKLHRVVAIKVMAAQLATNATARKRFEREARAQAALSHDHIVTIHAVEEAFLPSPLGGEGLGVRGSLPYLVMQFVGGMSLQERLDKSGPLQLHEIFRIGMQTASGLAAAHAQGLVHRDIKPANILLENGVERVKVTDFGLARAAADANMTQSGVVAGTPQYMSPEQAEGKAIDQRTDLFSLGSVLYAMCTGRAPFRASGSMAVLKRVCDETPTPIRETNPEIPDSLVAIIDKLQAKDPAQRYQSAAEVAELLGRHLAQVQHPSVTPLSSLGRGVGGEGRSHAQPRRSLAVAAGVLLCLIGGLSLAEATGLTNIRATVIRIFTPDGTLVVETDDPGVKVTIEGDGGLVVTGAGLEEIRLRPGAYKIHADRDGKPVPLEKELVSIAKGGREVVKVKLEAPPARAAPKAEPGPFVLLGGQGVAERNFDTLPEAVLTSCAGDTIEVRGDGPFVIDRVTVRHRLVIRAGSGYAPSITLSKAAMLSDQPGDRVLVTTWNVLVLEGLSLEGRDPGLLFAYSDGALHFANCRLIFKSDSPHNIFHSSAQSLFVRNSILSPKSECKGLYILRPGGRCSIDNCVLALGGFGFEGTSNPDVTDISLCIRGSTFVGNCLELRPGAKPNLPTEGKANPPMRLEFSGNVVRWDSTASNRGILYFHQNNSKELLSADEAEAFLPRLIRLDEKQNVYQAGTPMLSLGVYYRRPLAGKRGKDLADWDQFWGQKNTGSVEGDIRFQGGDLGTRARSAPERLTAEDFRLRPDSAGYRAGKDGKDLGADVDLLGPGAAYERWKKTPDYQQWLKDTGQKK